MGRPVFPQRHAGVFRCALPAAASLLLLSSCNQVVPSDSLGEAYVAPATLTLRRELTGKSDNVATLKHGEHVSVLDVRRRFVKIRSAGGMEGWVDSAQLLSKDQMAAIRKDTADALKLPSEGTASVYEALNIHIDPSRTSPAIAKIPEGGSVAVLAHRLSPKVPVATKPQSFIAERPTAPSRRRKDKNAKKINLPPAPKPPKAPENWQALSTERVNPSAESIAEARARKDAEAAARKAEAAKAPVVLEDWTMVRTGNTPGQAQVGWVLSRNLIMSIPDEVAQYAEGKRITSYFDLGSVNDEEKGLKHNWLWTTSSGQHTFDFDSWRVFLWNRHRHRYETSFRQRDVEGYFPVTVEPADANSFGRTFRLVTKDQDGHMRRRTYVFDSARVHLVNTEPFENGKPVEEVTETKTLDTTKLTGRTGNWFSRQWSWARSKLSGKKQ